MRATTLLFVVVLSVFLPSGLSESMRNLSEIRYHFTTCGQQGSSGPDFVRCHAYYSEINSPITNEDLLVNYLEQGDDYYAGAQRFRVPRTGRYNVTVAGAAGGRGICSTTSGKGLMWTGSILLTEDHDLLVLVGQKGLGPCDDSVLKTQELSLCSSPPANVTEAENCNQQWTDWINNDPNLPAGKGNSVRAIVGGGSGGGASFILPVIRVNELVNNRPIVIAPGGGGTAALEKHDIFDMVPKPGLTNLSEEEQFLLLINGQRNSSPSFDTADEFLGSRGFINVSITTPNIRPGAGGGWTSGSSSSTLSEGHAIGIDSQFAIGGQDCAIRLRSEVAGGYVPIRNVNGGFGGGGSQCAGGGAGGGYTGGSVFAATFFIPSGGGFFLGPQEAGYDVNNFVELDLELNSEENGFVTIVPSDCGCSYRCIVYEEVFKCTCPDGFQLTANEVDCYQGSEVNVTLLSSERQGEFTITPVVLQSTVTVFGVDVVLVNPEGATDWSCSVFLLGRNKEVIAATEPVRETQAKPAYIARVNSSNAINYQQQLSAPVAVTGALLVSNGGSCSLEGTSLLLNISNLEVTSAVLEQEDYNGFNYTMSQSVANSVLLEMDSTSTSGSGTTAGIPQLVSSDRVVIVVVSVLVVAVVLVLMVALACVGILFYRRTTNNKGRLEKLSSVHPKGKTGDYNDYTSNTAYDGKQLTNHAQYRVEINKFYEAGPPSNAPLDDEGYEAISYEVDGLKRLSMKRRTSINASARFFSPRHGISAPEHDFTPFNMHRSQNREWEYPRKDLIYLKELGEGEFGKVLLMKAQGIADYRGEIPVAVKTLSFKNQHLLDKFMEEINLMKKFAHPNIVGLLGTSTKDISQDSAPLMILEYMPFGDLHSFLSKHRPSIHKPRKSQKRIGPAHFFSFSKDVAEALAFLASQKHVHRDIAARNCLVGTGLQVKIADFGMARSFTAEKEIYKVEGKAVLPIRWLAPESLLYGIFSTASDVWSYGVLLWEIVTFGELPLTDLKTNQIVELAQTEDLIHSRPKNCPDEIYDVMCRCHMHKRNERISFDQIVEEFSKEDILKLMGEKEIEISGVH